MTDGPATFSRQRKPKTGDTGTIVAMAVAAVLVLALVAGWWLVNRTEHPTAPGKHVEVRIPQGAGIEQIGRTLSNYGVVGNALRFELRAKLSGSALRSGTYDLTTGMADEAVVKALAAGPRFVYYDVPIPEGFSAVQIARRFAARTGVSEDEMMSLVTSGASLFVAGHPYLADAAGGSLEGYLFPATYRIKKGTKPTAIVDMMLDKFDSETADLDLSYAKSKNLTFADIVTIGSILQRETKLTREYPIVASVVYNRLHQHMRLQLDSTVFYVAAEGTTKLTDSDLANPSPYNTYRHAGLPPGPICSPSIQALQAAAHPAKTPYLYYVLTGKDGSQTFTTNYKDFLAAVKKYHQVFGE